jgi:ATP-dependent DNA helicase RecG
MTATPIPRTAAMVLFGDLDRLGARRTAPRDVADRDDWARGTPRGGGRLGAGARRGRPGRRAYVICPLVEGSERVEATSAVEERTRLALGELRGLAVGLVHGQMKGNEKEEVMNQFRAGELDVLVATVVIEVGVDVPEASVIVIEDAWRFGLAQLHQLRGRVGRSDLQSYCYLLGEAPTDEGVARLEALVRPTTGSNSPRSTSSCAAKEPCSAPARRDAATCAWPGCVRTRTCSSAPSTWPRRWSNKTARRWRR